MNFKIASFHYQIVLALQLLLSRQIYSGRQNSWEWSWTHGVTPQYRLAYVTWKFRGLKRSLKTELSKTLSRVELFENDVFATTCGRTKTELFGNADVTLSVPIHSAQCNKLIQDGGEASLFLSFILGLISNVIACFQANLALIFFHVDY